MVIELVSFGLPVHSKSSEPKRWLRFPTKLLGKCRVALPDRNRHSRLAFCPRNGGVEMSNYQSKLPKITDVVAAFPLCFPLHCGMVTVVGAGRRVEGGNQDDQDRMAKMQALQHVLGTWPGSLYGKGIPSLFGYWSLDVPCRYIFANRVLSVLCFPSPFHYIGLTFD